MKKNAGFFAALLLVSALLLSACSARTPISADSFQKEAKSAGYQVSESSASASDAVKSLTAAKENSDTQISFSQFADASAAEESYASLKQSLTVTGGKNTVDSDSYNKYTAQNGEIYYTLVRMDNTLLFCKGTLEKKSEIDSFIQSIKY